jgi:hypothetical protein
MDIVRALVWVYVDVILFIVTYVWTVMGIAYVAAGFAS